MGRSALQLYEEAAGRVWSELAEAIQAKLRLIQAGRSTVEQEFLAFIILPDGASIGEWLGPQIEQAYSDGVLIPLLMAPVRQV